MAIKRNSGGDGWMIRYDNGTYQIVETQQEAIEIMAKIDTAKAIVSAVKTLTTATDLALDLEAEYFDVGTFIDEDVAALGITASDLASCITLLQQITALMTGQVTSPATYRSTLNKMRRLAT